MAQDQFVSSFEEACAKLGKDTTLPDVSTFPEHLQKHVLATYKLSTILEVNNGDWKPNLADTNQCKYFPWFRINKDKSRPSGFGLSYRGCDDDFTRTCLGSRLACSTEELAEFMGETFTDLYEDLLS